MSVYKLYSKKVRGQEELVYLYLYKLETGQKQPQLTALKIKIPKQYCLSSSKNFKKISKELPKKYIDSNGFKSVEQMNQFIQEQLEKFIKLNGIKDFIPKENKTLNNYFEILINRMLNQGSILRYKNVLNKIISFQKWYSVNVLKKQETSIVYMKDIDADYIHQFKKWLLSEHTERDKRITNNYNSCNYKLKCLKAVLNKSHFEGYYEYINNPFNHFTFTFSENKIEILTIDELKKIIDTNYEEVYRRTKLTKDGDQLWGKPIENEGVKKYKNNREYKTKHTLKDIKNYFLFQLLCQGIRVSDMVTLRWEHFNLQNETLRIDKTMVKTKQRINILVNEKMTSIISHYITRYDEVDPEICSEIKRVNAEINELYNYLFNDYYTFLGVENPYYQLFNNINENLKIFAHRHYVAYVVKESDIEELKRFLVAKKREGQLHNILNGGKPYRPSPISSLDDKIDFIINEVKKWFKEENKNAYNVKMKTYEALRKERHGLVSSLIMNLSNNEKRKYDFVFPLLENKFFLDIVNDDFSRLTEIQYRKFQSVRTYYNKLLKIIGEQSGINKRLTSHISRHSYTSLMLELGENVNLFDLMTSLGHKHLSTTQTYIQRISSKKVDKLNLVISENLNNGMSINL